MTVHAESFDPDRLRDLIEMAVDHRGGWDGVTDADLRDVQRSLLNEPALRPAGSVRPGPRPSADFPAVDPTHDLPAAVELIHRIAAEQHPYDAVLLGMAADVLDTRASRPGESYPDEDVLVEKVTSALFPDLGDRLTATRAVRVVLDEQARLRVTASDDDRSREWAERDDERRWDIGNVLGWELENESPSWREVMEGITDLRSFAAPSNIDPDPLAQVRVGDDDPTGDDAECPARDQLWRCTREEGHPGQHIAGDGSEGVKHVWHGRPCPQCGAPPAHPSPADAVVAPTTPGLTREQVIEAVDVVNRDLTDPRPFGEYVADRLGLTEDTGGEERR